MKPIVIPDIDNALIDIVVSPEEYKLRLIALREKEEELIQREKELNEKKEEELMFVDTPLYYIKEDIENISKTAQDIQNACADTLCVLKNMAYKISKYKDQSNPIITDNSN